MERMPRVSAGSTRYATPPEPDGGSQRSAPANNRMRSSPTQYTGNDTPTYETSMAIRSTASPGRIALLVSYVGVSFPVYWVGLLLILLFAVALRWLPPSGSGGLAYLVLPALTLGMRSIAFLARMTRAAMLDVLSSDFVRTARAKGLSEAAVILRHGFRNALIPVITVIGLDTGSYLTGSILTETIFGWPGLGRYVLSAIEKRDLPAIQGSILFMSLVFLLVNLVTDLVYAKADPRIAYD